MDNKIKIKELNLSVAGQPILKNIRLDIPKNKITVILGPSGCGKTTLLKTLNRLSDLIPGVQRSGQVFLEDKDILNGGMDLVDIRRKMGLLAQRPYPLPMSIFNNISYGLRISGRHKKKLLEKRVEHYLKMVNLWDEVKDRLHGSASDLSIGQQQRLCLARGLAVDPEIILADEPTSALDPISSRAIEEKFLELKNQYTIVMVTHILRQAKRMADYVVFMYLGEIIECGTPDELFNNPQHPITKSYLSGQFY
ncbi:MAG: phosphate ABC transporter ATP-binding protein [Bacteroidales bacterium]|jgi:phosphate transport system ATP-binding protein|nr:phosphate ABC transporter ATP-binding protein [Bacteroidales bacterium]